MPAGLIDLILNECDTNFRRIKKTDLFCTKIQISRWVNYFISASTSYLEVYPNLRQLFPSYGNQSIDLHRKSIDRVLYDGSSLLQISILLTLNK